eukprot:TRINITY_DN1506_c0_g1_i8.p1 TRINITY_DN1506_c0_g1~~TRINITY_DN1506_c0_g1_i8.p1  ORF type:complete len:687 (-),score=33.00 TRINITY_DN1506_c0_g1_i8:371-2431(-)
MYEPFLMCEDSERGMFSIRDDSERISTARNRLLSRGQSIEYVAMFGEPNIMMSQQAEVVHEHQEYGLITRRVLSVNEKQWERCIQLRNKQRLQNRVDGRSVINLPTIHPTSYFVIYWSVIILFVDAIYTAYVLPFEVAFRRDQWNSNFLEYSDIIVDFVYIFDFLLSLHVGYIIMYNGQRTTAMSGRTILHFYLFNGTFWIDLLTVVSCIMETGAQFFGYQRRSETLVKVFLGIRIARIMRLIRVVWIIKMSYLTALFAVEPVLMRIFTNSFFQMLNILYCLSTIVNLLGCFFYEMAKYGGTGIEESWVAANGLLDATTWRKYLASVYFTLTTVSTVGYGDIHPVTWVEQLAAILIILVGLVFFAFLVGIINELLAATSRRMSSGQMFKDKMRMVSEWMNIRALSPSLRNEIYKFYSVLASYEENPDQMFIEELPMKLRTKAVYEMILPAVDFIPGLRGIPKDTLEQFASRLLPLNSPPGKDLCHEGDCANTVWLLLDGTIGVARFQKDLHEIRAPALLADSILVADSLPKVGERRLCTFTCKTVCRIMSMHGSDLLYILKLYPPMKDAMLARLRRFVDKCLSFFPEGDQQLEALKDHLHEQMIQPKIEDKIFYEKAELEGKWSPNTLTSTVSLAASWMGEDSIQEQLRLLLNKGGGQYFGSEQNLPPIDTQKSLNTNTARAKSDA